MFLASSSLATGAPAASAIRSEVLVPSSPVWAVTSADITALAAVSLGLSLGRQSGVTISQPRQIMPQGVAVTAQAAPARTIFM
jgi:hypothetical protein